MIIEAIFGAVTGVVGGLVGLLPTGHLGLPQGGGWFLWYSTFNEGLPCSELLTGGGIILACRYWSFVLNVALKLYHLIPGL